MLVAAAATLAKESATLRPTELRCVPSSSALRAAVIKVQEACLVLPLLPTDLPGVTFVTNRPAWYYRLYQEAGSGCYYR